ncbi:DUF1385 domain-containing protein [Neofamilia massiliensis]|uniref:DUF1385 domain-containing protein n=1 Tax=Neofamilia massiliensis TaxID=1673724 RepID=UPI0006BB7661|nr:DUF1385 domain-containing protein [Neofamilia massiliensis]
MKKTSIGGQALIEGIMMRGPSQVAIAVRKPDNEIVTKVDQTKSIIKKSKILGLPFIRGVVALGEAMVTGVSALMYSASFWEDEEEDGKSSELTGLQTFGIIASSFLMAMALFMLLPNLITSFFMRYTDSPLALNIIEGILRLTIFFIYLIYVSKLEDIKRVFEYHGAEHKSIHCYENGLDLTVENIRKFPIMHKRCGTSFLFMVMFISIIVLSFFGWPNLVMRIVSRIIALPIVAGISYEVNKLIGKYDNKLCSALAYPGLMIQKLATVKEPDDSQIEVAIAALKLVLPKDGEDDSW